VPGKAPVLLVLMPIYRIERRQIVPVSLSGCWRFFSDPRNLEKITPPGMRFTIKNALPVEIYPGLMIEYTVAPLLGIPLTWLTEIVQVDSPHRFVDEQRVGPYRVWHHEHSFRALTDGETEVHDLVTYAPPLGPLGALLNRLVIRPQLERIFDYRGEHLPCGPVEPPA
jgi:ligand-binding SRPBCC domain-containing protein